MAQFQKDKLIGYYAPFIFGKEEYAIVFDVNINDENNTISYLIFYSSEWDSLTFKCYNDIPVLDILEELTEYFGEDIDSDIGKECNIRCLQYFECKYIDLPVTDYNTRTMFNYIKFLTNIFKDKSLVNKNVKKVNLTINSSFSINITNETINMTDLNKESFEYRLSKDCNAYEFIEKINDYFDEMYNTFAYKSDYYSKEAEESEYEEIQFSLSIEYDNGSIISIDGIIPDWFEDEE